MRRWRPRRAAGLYDRMRRSRRGRVTNRSTLLDVSISRLGPERQGAVPGSSLPFSPSLTGGATSVNAGCVLAVHGDDDPPLDGEQNLQSLEVHLPPGLSGILSNVELCPNRRPTRALRPEQPDRRNHGQRGCRRRPFTVRAGSSISPAPITAAAAARSAKPVARRSGSRLRSRRRPARSTSRKRRPTIPRATACSSAARSKSTRYRGGHDHLRPSGHAGRDPDEHRRHPPGNPARQRDHDPRELPVQPDELQQDGSHRDDPFQRRRYRHDRRAVPGHELRHAEVRAEIRGLDVREDQQSDRCEPDGEADLPDAPFGTQANIAKVKVELPKQLPSRLTTLQKACTAAQFEANPAGCPAASIDRAREGDHPAVPVPLEGPAYFVCHGGEAFPSPDDRAAGLRRDDRSRRHDVHQQSRDHLSTRSRRSPTSPSTASN